MTRLSLMSLLSSVFLISSIEGANNTVTDAPSSIPAEGANNTVTDAPSTIPTIPAECLTCYGAKYDINDCVTCQDVKDAYDNRNWYLDIPAVLQCEANSKCFTTTNPPSGGKKVCTLAELKAAADKATRDMGSNYAYMVSGKLRMDCPSQTSCSADCHRTLVQYKAAFMLDAQLYMVDEFPCIIDDTLKERMPWDPELSFMMKPWDPELLLGKTLESLQFPAICARGITDQSTTTPAATTTKAGCLSCYGAKYGTDDCVTCQDVKDAYTRRSWYLDVANTAQCYPTAKCPYDGNSISDQELKDKMKGLVVVGTAVYAAVIAVFVIVWIVVPISICLCCINKVKVCRPNPFFEFLHIHPLLSYKSYYHCIWAEIVRPYTLISTFLIILLVFLQPEHRATATNAYLFWFFLGPLGVHRCYLGYTGSVSKATIRLVSEKKSLRHHISRIDT
jgi:hypothetical protein